MCESMLVVVLLLLFKAMRSLETEDWRGMEMGCKGFGAMGKRCEEEEEERGAVGVWML